MAPRNDRSEPIKNQYSNASFNKRWILHELICQTGWWMSFLSTESNPKAKGANKKACLNQRRVYREIFAASRITSPRPSSRHHRDQDYKAFFFLHLLHFFLSFFFFRLFFLIFNILIEDTWTVPLALFTGLMSWCDPSNQVLRAL